MFNLFGSSSSRACAAKLAPQALALTKFNLPRLPAIPPILLDLGKIAMTAAAARQVSSMTTQFGPLLGPAIRFPQLAIPPLQLGQLAAVAAAGAAAKTAFALNITDPASMAKLPLVAAPLATPSLAALLARILPQIPDLKVLFDLASALAAAKAAQQAFGVNLFNAGFLPKLNVALRAAFPPLPPIDLSAGTVAGLTSMGGLATSFSALGIRFENMAVLNLAASLQLLGQVRLPAIPLPVMQVTPALIAINFIQAVTKVNLFQVNAGLKLSLALEPLMELEALKLDLLPGAAAAAPMASLLPTLPALRLPLAAALKVDLGPLLTVPMPDLAPLTLAARLSEELKFGCGGTCIPGCPGAS